MGTCKDIEWGAERESRGTCYRKGRVWKDRKGRISALAEKLHWNPEEEVTTGCVTVLQGGDLQSLDCLKTQDNLLPTLG